MKKLYSDDKVLQASFIFWAIYMVGIGASLTFAPHIMAIVLNFPAPQDNWIRLFGGLATIIGAGYAVILQSEVNIWIVRWTIGARLYFFSLTLLSVWMGWFPPILILTGAFDFLNAMWTLVGLRRFQQKQEAENIDRETNS
ncbi:MAG: hypothetical protein LBD38_00310 [Streptococcaceae bacterium]|jgi:hypothetical protein|nr:hypothetical protein [Streptococcaceae bacterium]